MTLRPLCGATRAMCRRLLPSSAALYCPLASGAPPHDASLLTCRTTEEVRTPNNAMAPLFHPPTYHGPRPHDRPLGLSSPHVLFRPRRRRSACCTPSAGSPSTAVAWTTRGCWSGGACGGYATTSGRLPTPVSVMAPHDSEGRKPRRTPRPSPSFVCDAVPIGQRDRPTVLRGARAAVMPHM